MENQGYHFTVQVSNCAIILQQLTKAGVQRMSHMGELIANATLHIYESGIHKRQEMSTRGRCAPFYVMSYVQVGEAELIAEGVSYELSPGSVILIPPEVEHDHIKRGEEPTTFLWWHFDLKILDKLDLLRLLGLPMVFSITETKEFEDAFTQYAQLFSKPVNLQNTIMQKAYAMIAMAYLLSAAPFTNEYQSVGIPEPFRGILEYILSSDNSELSLLELSSRFGLHPTYISNRFKRFFGVSPVLLHRQVLIQRAKDKLSVEGMTVSEVSDKLGFSSVSVFSRFFTTHTGCPPSQFTAQGGEMFRGVRL